MSTQPLRNNREAFLIACRNKLGLEFRNELRGKEKEAKHKWVRVDLLPKGSAATQRRKGFIHICCNDNFQQGSSLDETVYQHHLRALNASAKGMMKPLATIISDITSIFGLAPAIPPINTATESTNLHATKALQQAAAADLKRVVEETNSILDKAVQEAAAADKSTVEKDSQPLDVSTPEARPPPMSVNELKQMYDDHTEDFPRTPIFLAFKSAFSLLTVGEGKEPDKSDTFLKNILLHLVSMPEIKEGLRCTPSGDILMLASEVKFFLASSKQCRSS